MTKYTYQEKLRVAKQAYKVVKDTIDSIEKMDIPIMCHWDECITVDDELFHSRQMRQPGNSRKCIECGRMHDTIVEDTRTGERLSKINKCKDCLMSGCKFNWRTDQVELRSEWGGTARCMTSDGRNIKMAEELNRLERELLDG